MNNNKPTFIEFLKEQSNYPETIDYDNWTFPDQDTMEFDFWEYEKKEEKKWKQRANQIGMRFPIFDDFEHFKQSLQQGQITYLSDINEPIHNKTNVDSVEQLKNLVSSYVYPRDVDRIVNGFINSDPIPMPIVLKGQKGLWKMTGNTRTNAAQIFNIPVQVIVVDAVDK